MEYTKEVTQEDITELWETLGTGLTQAAVGLVNRDGDDVAYGLSSIKEAFKHLNNAWSLGAPVPNCEFIPEPSEDDDERRAEMIKLFEEMEAEGAPTEVIDKMKRTVAKMDSAFAELFPEANEATEDHSSLLDAIKAALAQDGIVVLSTEGHNRSDSDESEPAYRPGRYL